MIKPLVTVCLENDVKGFSVTDCQLESLRQKCPCVDIKRVVSDTELESIIDITDFIVTWKFKESWYRKAVNLRAIATPAAGNDWIAIDRNYPVPVINGTFHGAIMAESLLGMILFFNRRFDRLLENKSRHIYDRNILSPVNMLGREHVVIIGYGSIGRYAAKVLKTFNCRVTGVKRNISCVDKGSADSIISFDNLHEVLGDADHVVAILPNDKSTDDILTADHFVSMKRSAYFYNLGRGNCCREQTLVDALKKGHIAGAALDVFETEPLPDNSELWTIPSVFIMPHASAICRQYLDLYFDELAGKINAMYSID